MARPRRAGASSCVMVIGMAMHGRYPCSSGACSMKTRDSLVRSPARNAVVWRSKRPPVDGSSFGLSERKRSADHVASMATCPFGRMPYSARIGQSESRLMSARFPLAHGTQRMLGLSMLCRYRCRSSVSRAVASPLTKMIAIVAASMVSACLTPSGSVPICSRWSRASPRRSCPA
jgi:hypothetical protein